jgi:hypothetical protein
MPVPPPARVERDSMGELPVPEGAYYPEAMTEPGLGTGIAAG